MHTNYLDKSQACTGQASLRGLKMPAYTRNMIKTINSLSFKGNTTKKEVKSQPKHPWCKKVAAKN